MMEPVVELLLKNGVFGILAGIGFYLFFKERKISQDLLRQHFDQSVASTAATTKLTAALEDMTRVVEVSAAKSASEVDNCRSHVREMTSYVKNYLERAKIEKAREAGREEGRREVTGKIKIPVAPGEDDDERI
jgi:hypothetical protein